MAQYPLTCESVTVSQHTQYRILKLNELCIVCMNKLYLMFSR